MNKIEEHIADQIEEQQKLQAAIKTWRAAAPEIRERILSQFKQIKALEAQHSKALKRIESLEKRIESLESKPTGIRSLF